ncbi:hypothetical protein Bbelb_283300 [Branchiostoma belcheri]|nr:hypothetical protein Bbelb_283300 [Branchiostoma belcheri]
MAEPERQAVGNGQRKRRRTANVFQRWVSAQPKPGGKDRVRETYPSSHRSLMRSELTTKARLFMVTPGKTQRSRWTFYGKGDSIRAWFESSESEVDEPSTSACRPLSDDEPCRPLSEDEPSTSACGSLPVYQMERSTRTWKTMFIAYGESVGYLIEQKRQIAGHSLALSFILNGNTYEKYNQALHLGLGILIFSFNTYYNILSKAYPHVHNILDVQMKRARANMKEMDPTKVGSWKRAVTSGDGVYHTRGHHTVHLCMRGKDVTTADSVPLFPGTSKSAEGFELIWEELKHEGMEVEVHWQDADSTREKSFKKLFSESKVMYCGGHVGRAHGKQLEKLASMKTFSKGYRDIVPLVQSGTDAALYAKRMRALGQHHARNIHKWKGGSYNFHGKKRCTCKKFDPLDVQCTGEMYKTSHPLTCTMHSMAYEIECEERAAKAEDVIHPEMGRGHSNYPQPSNNVLIRFARSQDLSPGDILPGVTEVQSLKERLSVVVKSHLRENFMEFSALPATNTTRRWVPAVQYTPVELLDRCQDVLDTNFLQRQAPYGQKRRKIVSDRYAKLIFWLQPGREGHYVGIVKAKIKFFDYRGGGQYAPTQASELVDPKYVYLVDFPTRKLMGGKIQVDNMEEIIQQYKSEKQQRLKAIISSLNTKNVDPTDHKTYVVRRDNVWRALEDKLTKKNFDASKMVKVKFIGEEDTLDFGGPKNEMFRMALQGIFETSGLFEHSPHGYLPISSPIAIVNGDFETAGKAMAMSIVHLGPTPSCLHPAIVSALCGEDLPDMSGFHPVDQEAAAFVTKLESATEGSLKDLLESDVGLNITTMAGWQKPAGSTILADIPTLRKALCLQDLVISRKAAIEHLKQGLDLLGLRKALEAEPQLLAELLCKSTKKTTATNIIDMMVCKFSAEGSSRENVQKDVFDKLCSWMDDVESVSADTDLTLATLEPPLYHLVQKVLERHPHSTKSQFRRLFGLNHKTYEVCLKKLANEANWSTVLKEAAVIRGRKCKLRTPPSKNWLRTEMYDSGTPDDLPVSAPEPSARETDLTKADLGHTDGSFLTITTTVHDIFRRNRTWREAFKVRDTSIALKERTERLEKAESGQAVSRPVLEARAYTARRNAAFEPSTMAALLRALAEAAVKTASRCYQQLELGGGEDLQSLVTAFIGDREQATVAETVANPVNPLTQSRQPPDPVPSTPDPAPPVNPLTQSRQPPDPVPSTPDPVPSTPDPVPSTSGEPSSKTIEPPTPDKVPCVELKCTAG